MPQTVVTRFTGVDPSFKHTEEQPSPEAGATPLAGGAIEAGAPPAPKRQPPPPRAKASKEQAPPLDRTPGALVGKTLRHEESDGVRECVVTERGFEFGGQVYTSISGAAKAASGRVAANGWEYWR